MLLATQYDRETKQLLAPLSSSAVALHNSFTRTGALTSVRDVGRLGCAHDANVGDEDEDEDDVRWFTPNGAADEDVALHVDEVEDKDDNWLHSGNGDSAAADEDWLMDSAGDEVDEDGRRARGTRSGRGSSKAK